MPVVGYRKPEYMSPSSLACYEENPEEFYTRYLSNVRAPKLAQTLPMSVGSAFDAYAKSWLHHALFGANHKDSEKFSLRTLFEAQVEPLNRDWAFKAGGYVFECYKSSGILADLLIELNGAIDTPRFEFDIKGVINGFREGVTTHRIGVPILGKPDLRFVNKEGLDVIADWKVNGYCGRAKTSPTAGYIQLVQPESHPGIGAMDRWTRMGEHRAAMVQTYKGMKVNIATYFEAHDKKWATQLTSYGWLLGIPVGGEFITGIHQVACDGGSRDHLDRPSMRFAIHSSRISHGFQFETLARYQRAWSVINTEPLHLFKDQTVAENDRRIAILDAMIANLGTGLGPLTDSEWVAGIARSAQLKDW